MRFCAALDDNGSCLLGDEEIYLLAQTSEFAALICHEEHQERASGFG